MNYIKLIELVKEREVIYNSKHPHHRNRDLIAALWKDIGNKLNTSDIEAKSKWQNLRSNYMRERRKLKTLSLGAKEDGGKIGWPYFSMMTFLENNCFHRKRLTGIVPEYLIEFATSKASENENLDESVNSWNDETNTYSDTDLKDEATPVTPVDLKEKVSQNLSAAEVDKQHLKQLEMLSYAAIDNNDPDLLFFRSLLPQIKQLDSNENLSFKVEVAQLLLKKLKTAAITSSNGI